MKQYVKMRYKKWDYCRTIEPSPCVVIEKKQRDMLDLIALQTVAENFGFFSELPQSYKDSLK